MIPLPQTVFVFWRSPRANDLHPVGRLVVNSGSPRFEFDYVKDVAGARAQGFALFLDFPELERTYASDQLFPLFANRLMSASRPDYRSWIERHGLSADTADEVSLLLRTDGHRATDRVELLAAPARQDGRPMFTSWFFVRGVPPDQEPVVAALVPNDKLEISTAHQEALRTGLKTTDGTVVGYVPNSTVFQLQDAVADAVRPSVIVERVNLPPVPLHHRLLCRLEVSPSSASKFFRAERFEPVSRVSVSPAPSKR